MIEAPPQTARVPAQRDHRTTRPARSDEPVFAALATEYRAAGRIVPGDRDREWVDTVVRKVWR